MTGELILDGNKITVLRDPTSAEDAANKQYVDNEVTKNVTLLSKSTVNKTGDTMIGELNLGGNKITKLANPILAEDATNKYYVDGANAQMDARLITLRTEYDAHVNQFTRLRRNYQKTDEVAEKFFGNTLTVDMKLTEIKTSLSDINTRLGVVRESRSFSDLILGMEKITNDTKKY